jgi:hypothetical protein
MTIPVIDLDSVIRVPLTGAAGGGAAERRNVPPGVYIVIVHDGEALIRDGDADTLSPTTDVPFRADVLIAIRVKKMRVTLAARGAQASTVWLVPVLNADELERASRAAKNGICLA